VFQETRDELLERFGAVSSYLQIIRGEWEYEGSKYTDETQKIFVDVDDTPENRAFFAAYKLTAARAVRADRHLRPLLPGRHHLDIGFGGRTPWRCQIRASRKVRGVDRPFTGP
jgi:hypothetical protein